MSSGPTAAAAAGALQVTGLQFVGQDGLCGNQQFGFQNKSWKVASQDTDTENNLNLQSESNIRVYIDNGLF